MPAMRRWARRPLSWCLALGAATSAAGPRAALAQQDGLDGLTPERLGALLSLELQAEDQREPEQPVRFTEFQDMSELGCRDRLFYLINETANTHGSIHSYHDEVLGLAGLFVKLLQLAPQENSWLWALVSSHHQTLQKVQAYWARVCALALDQHQCLPADVRNVILDAVARWKTLHADLTAMLWNSFAFGIHGDMDAAMERGRALAAGTPQHEEPLSVLPPTEKLLIGNAWISTVAQWFGDYARGLLQVLQTRESSGVELEPTVRLHHQDEQGSFVTYEFLRRKVFKQWAIDKGLLRGLIWNVWQPPLGSSSPVTLGDFGAGGGHYSAWLNETGLIQSFAFDGTSGAATLTDGLVQEINLVEEMKLWRTFDWVMCLEVGEHIPKQFSKTLLQNLRRHARLGLVMSWSEDWEGIGHVNCLPRAEFIDMVERETGFKLDADATEAVKASCEIDYIARTIAVFRARS